MRAKIFNKGQIVLPVALRKKYDISIGDMIEVVAGDNEIKLIPVKKENLTDKLFGVFNEYTKDKPQITDDIINQATESAFIEGYKP